MALPVVGDAAYPTPNEIHNQLLADYAFDCARKGLTANVLPGSDAYIRFRAVANRISIAISNNKVALAAFSPLTATGDALDDLCGVFGLSRRAAAGAAGYVTITCTGVVAIPQGFQCTMPSGAKYQTTGASVVASGASIAVAAVGTGADTDQDAGTVGTWDSSAIGALSQSVVVADTGIVGGADADSDERLRARLIRKLSFPGVGGNVSQVIEWAEESSSSVEVGYCYAAIRGPASYDVAVTAAGGDRTLSAATLATVSAYILARMPGHADLNVTSVDGEGVDVIINATLPLPTNAGGAGGGWRDPAPWPSTADSALAKVTAASGNTITVDSTALDTPVAGKRFGIWDAAAGAMKEFTILSVGGAPGAYVITIDPTVSASLSFVAVGMYCSAGAVLLTSYATDFLAQCEALGPGEKTTSTDILPRGRRQVGPDVSNPASLTVLQLSGVTVEHDEVLNLEYAARYATGTTTPLTSPSLPATTADPPSILVLQNLSFRRAT